MAEVNSSAQDEKNRAGTPLFPHLHAWEEQRRVLDELMAELANLVVEILAAPVSTSSPASTRMISARKEQWFAETLLHWPGSTIIIDPDAVLWYGAAVKKISLAGQHEVTPTRLLRFALTEVLAPHFSYNPLKLLPRFTQDELADFTEIAKLLISDPSEEGEAAALLLLAVLLRYIADTSEPSLQGLAQFVEEPSRDSGMKLISHLSNINDLERPEHLFSAVLADEFQLLEDEAFVEEMFERVRSTLWPFTTPLGERTRDHDFQIADLCNLQEPTTLYITFPRHDVERLAPFLRLLCTQFARSLRNVTIQHPLLIAFTGANIVQIS